jgi:hypothetical protein
VFQNAFLEEVPFWTTPVRSVRGGCAINKKSRFLRDAIQVTQRPNDQMTKSIGSVGRLVK